MDTMRAALPSRDREGAVLSSGSITKRSCEARLTVPDFLTASEGTVLARASITTDKLQPT
jgi:hypothetical protein